MIPALFLGTIVSAILVVALRYTSWVAVVLGVALQAGALYAWWREKGKKVGATVWLPCTLWLLAVLGVDVFFSIIENTSTATVVLVGLGLLTALSYWLWFERYKFAPEYQKRFIGQWYASVTTFAIFVWAAAGFSFFTWLRLPVWVSATVLGSMAACGVWVTLFGSWFVHGLGMAHKEGRAEIFWSLTVVGMIIFELVWILHFFPLGFFVNAYLVAAFYIMLTMILRVTLARRGFAKNEKAGIVFMSALTVLVVFFARWI